MQFPTFKNEIQILGKGFDFVAGCDEVGVGPLAGPVVASACILDPKAVGAYRSKNKWYYRVRDSKTTTEKERETLLQEILGHCLAYGIGEVPSQQIDQLNIRHATMLAMKIAVMNMLIKLQDNNQHVDKSQAHVHIFIDGRFVVKNLAETGRFTVQQKAVVDGDASILSISAASIIAKVHRDNLLKRMDQQMPEYGFAKHKGYNTKEHREAIIKNGVTDFHRKSFLKNMLLQQQY